MTKWKPHPLYGGWQQMKQRCSNPNNINYKHYGARGISVCESWRSSFSNFLADMGEKPEGHSLERIDNDGPYSPENCKWATEVEQKRNQRNTIKVVIGGVEYIAIELAHKSGLKCDTIVCRAKKGLTMDEVMSRGRHYYSKRKITDKYRSAIATRNEKSRSRPFCKHGHKWPEHQRIARDGKVNCKVCDRDKALRWKAKKQGVE